MSGRLEGDKAGRWLGAGDLTSANCSLVTTDNFLTFSFFTCKILFSLQGVVRLHRSRK